MKLSEIAIVASIVLNVSQCGRDDEPNRVIIDKSPQEDGAESSQSVPEDSARHDENTTRKKPEKKPAESNNQSPEPSRLPQVLASDPINTDWQLLSDFYEKSTFFKKYKSRYTATIAKISATDLVLSITHNDADLAVVKDVTDYTLKRSQALDDPRIEYFVYSETGNWGENKTIKFKRVIASGECEVRYFKNNWTSDTSYLMTGLCF